MERKEAAKRREGNEIEFSRIVAFSDGVFSIAITLLVLNLLIPAGKSDIAHEIWEQRQNLIAYGISFAVIGRFWLVHHRFFGEVTAFDSRLIALNLVYLGFIVLIPFSSSVIGDYGGETISVVVYAVNLAAVVLIGLWMSADARRAGLTTIDDQDHREAWVRSLFIAAVFMLSIPVAFVAPELAPLIWLVLFFDPTERLVARAGD